LLHTQSASKPVICLLLAFTLLLPLLSYNTARTSGVSAGGNSISVPGTYSTIQAAVNNAESGDTIEVAAGTYVENVLVKKDNLQIIGHGMSDTVLNGNVTGRGFQIEANQVSVSGFNVTNCETAILVNNASGCSITDNYVTTSKFGIWLSYSSNCNVQRNKVVDCEHNVRLSFSTNNILKDNDIRGYHSYNFALFGSSIDNYFQTIDKSNKVNDKSIYYITNAQNLNINPQTCPDLGCLLVINSSKITVQDLLISNSYDGILFAYVSSSTIQNVATVDNKIGIELSRSQDCNILNSLLKYNMYHGILLSGSSRCLIDGNNITGNTDGVYLSSSNSSVFVRNTISQSEIGLKLDQSYDNQFFHNNLVSNTQQTGIYSSQGNVFDNGQEGNYWSSYRGEDTDNDAIGDTSLPFEQFDSYPLMGKYQEFTVTKDGQSYFVEAISNSEIYNAKFNPSNGTLEFSATGEEENCFCKLVMPNALLSDSSKVIVNNAKPIVKTEATNDTHTTLYIVYQVSVKPIDTGANASFALVADAGPDQTTIPNVIVWFNGNGSGGNEITGYYWGFGDGLNGTGVTVNHTYTQSGKYTVTLEVIDSAGNRDSDSLTVTVGDSTPNPVSGPSRADLEAPLWSIILIAVIDCCGTVAVVALLARRQARKPGDLSQKQRS
jgi:parallel beta-helix repeat protein